MTTYFNRKGKPINQSEYGRLHDDHEYRWVAETTLPDGKWISTVWLGLNYAFDDGSPPLIFETMVFNSQESLDDLDMRRYQTEEGARIGHELTVLQYSLGLVGVEERTPDKIASEEAKGVTR